MNVSKKEFDAIVVGSGPGGATVARELSRKGKSVLILEWGDNAPVTGSIWQMIPRGMIPGKSLFVTGPALRMVRRIATGGSSQLYCATAFDPPVDMLKSYGVDINDEVSGEELDDVIDSYADLIDDYIEMVKEAEAGDISSLAAYVKIAKKAEELGEKINDVSTKFSDEQREKFEKLQEKYKEALEEAGK